MKYLVKISEKARILKLKRRYFEDYYSDIQYAISIKDDMAYLCLHSPKTTKETSSIRRLRKKYRLSLKNDMSPRDKAKVTTIKEAKDLATLPLDELIGNLKVYEMILKNDGVASNTTKEKVKSFALKAKVTREQTSGDSDSQGGRDEDVDEL
uniref:UBN2 domain-containing protein n=1 Tax=Tanacetum cinerariifolium TaxID=118510 RepID=A0A699HBJ7_TANCI|nr:UBN2 domain-containing protein [Tanacetum cinerariifolium]